MSNLALVFSLSGNNWTLQCKSTDVIGDVFNKFCFKTQLNLKNLVFYFNSIEIKKDSGKTIESLGLKNYANINVVDNGVLGA